MLVLLVRLCMNLAWTAHDNLKWIRLYTLEHFFPSITLLGEVYWLIDFFPPSNCIYSNSQGERWSGVENFKTSWKWGGGLAVKTTEWGTESIVR